MAHAYTPGLRVTDRAVLRRERRLPLKGEVLVSDVRPGEGVIVEACCAFLQGIFGVGGETHGELAIAAAGPEQELTVAKLEPAHRGKVVVGGSRVSYATLMRAKEIGVAAVVAGGF